MGCGVRQGDNLALTLFITVMQIVSQVMQDKFDHNGISSPSFHHNSNTAGHIRLNNTKINYSDTDRLPLLLYVDDGALIFTNFTDNCDGCQIASDTISQFGLTVHIGQNNTKAKFEAMFFPSRTTIRKWKSEFENRVALKSGVDDDSARSVNST